MALDSPHGSKILDLGNPSDRSHPLNHGRLLWWNGIPQRSGGSTWFDLVGGHPGAITGGQPWVPTPYGQGLSTNGSSQYASATLSAVTGPFSLAAWLNGSNTADFSVPLGSNTSLAWYWQRTGSGCDVNLYTAGGQFHGLSVAGAFNGTWHRLLAVYTGSVWNAYLDGVQKATTAASGAVEYNGNGFTGLGAGAFSGGGNYFAGKLADVSLWSDNPLAGDDPDGFARLDYDLSRRGYPRGLNWYVPRTWSLPPSAPPVTAPGDDDSLLWYCRTAW